MADSEAASRTAPSLFGEHESFEAEVPPSPFASVARTTLAPDRDRSTPLRDRRAPDAATVSRAAPGAEPRPVVSAAPPAAGRGSVRPSTDQEIHPRRIVSQIRRLLRFDETVFDDLRADSSQSLAALLVAAGSMVLAALGGWLWLAVDAEGLSTGAIALREFFLGSILLFVAWGMWMGCSRLLLVRAFGREAEAGAVMRTMGFASVPLAAQVLMVIPPIAFGVGLISLVAWFGASYAGLRRSAPQATPKELLAANGLGFAVLALMMSALASAAAIAPGVFAHGADLTKLI